MLQHTEELKEYHWAEEAISERFDDVIDMIPENAVVYGGVLRDIIAGKELVGDIDIAVTPGDFDNIVYKFISNPKWISVSEHEDKKKALHYTEGVTSPTIIGMRSFKTLNGITAQLMKVNAKNYDIQEIFGASGRNVDIICCGIVMTSNGQVFEVVKGAHEDCKNNILQLNKSRGPSQNPEALNIRIEKLTKRGWKSLITRAQIERYMKKAEKPHQIDVHF